MYKYKILLNGSGGYYFSSLINKEIIDYWLNKKSIELLEEYILAQHMQDDEIDDEWRIPEEYRFDIFNNIKSTCLWESDSVDYKNSTICDIYKLLTKNDNLIELNKESDFNKHELIKSFLCSNEIPVNRNESNWNKLVEDALNKKGYSNAFIIYFKTNARGYATHDEILNLNEPININHLKFYTKVFGEGNIKSNVIKKAIYNSNTTDEKVLYDFFMLDSARESLDYNFIAIQQVLFKDKKFIFNWIKY